MQNPKMLASLIAIFVAMVIAYCLGYKAKSTEKYGGIFGTFAVFSIYGILPVIAMIILMETFHKLGIWTRGGDTDIGPGLTPILAVPLYWVSVFMGIATSKITKL